VIFTSKSQKHTCDWRRKGRSKKCEDLLGLKGLSIPSIQPRASFFCTIDHGNLQLRPQIHTLHGLAALVVKWLQYIFRDQLLRKPFYLWWRPPALTGGTAILVQTKAMNYAAGLSICLASACVINPCLVASSSSALAFYQAFFRKSALRTMTRTRTAILVGEGSQFGMMSRFHWILSAAV
jgi:hypothetical protein